MSGYCLKGDCVWLLFLLGVLGGKALWRKCKRWSCLWTTQINIFNLVERNHWNNSYRWSQKNKRMNIRNLGCSESTNNIRDLCVWTRVCNQLAETEKGYYYFSMQHKEEKIIMNLSCSMILINTLTCYHRKGHRFSFL